MSYDLKHIRQAINIKTNGQDAYNNEPSIIEYQILSQFKSDYIGLPSSSITLQQS